MKRQTGESNALIHHMGIKKMEHIQPPRAPKWGGYLARCLPCQSWPDNQREKTGGAVCLNPRGHDKKSEWKESEKEELVFLRPRAKLASNINTHRQTHTSMHTPTTILELSKSILVFSCSSFVFHPSDAALKRISVWW